jgi:hypothetical protein
MAKNKILAERILRLVEGGDFSKDSQIDIRDILNHIPSAVASIIRADIDGKRVNVDSEMVSGQFVVSYTQEVKKDTARGESYAELPHTPMALSNNRGVQQVSGTKGRDNVFIPVRHNSGGFNSLRRVPKSRYYIEGDKIFFPDVIEEKNVLVKMVGKVSTDPEEDSGIPIDMESKVIEIVYAWITGQDRAEKDNSNDGVDG